MGDLTESPQEPDTLLLRGEAVVVIEIVPRGLLAEPLPYLDDLWMWHWASPSNAECFTNAIMRALESRATAIFAGNRQNGNRVLNPIE
jgi:hypothetical protein